MARKGTTCSARAWALLNDLKHTEAGFFDDFDDLAVLTIPSDIQISRSGDFRANSNNNNDDDDDRHTNQSLYPLRMRTG